ncbi:hypothetical protein D3C71_1829480 [compost metagenome]
MRCRVTTLTDCGVSRSDKVRPVAADVAGVVYDPVPSVMAGSELPVTVTGARLVTPPSRDRMMLSPCQRYATPVPCSRLRNASSGGRLPRRPRAFRPATTSGA